jgi:hypothetical protein
MERVPNINEKIMSVPEFNKRAVWYLGESPNFLILWLIWPQIADNNIYF